MSTNLAFSPSSADADLDRVSLEARLQQLRRSYAQRPRHFVPAAPMDEIALAAARAAYDAETQQIIREQIEIIAKLRRTSAGPARKGGKRAKSAPLDLGALMGQLLKSQ